MNEPLTKLLSDLPDVLVDPGHWPRLLKQVSNAANVQHLFIADRDSEANLLLTTEPWKDRFVHGYHGESGLTPYVQYFRHIDEWGRHELTDYTGHARIVSSLPGGKLHKSDEFWEFLIPKNIDENAYARLFKTPNGWVGINFHFDTRYAEREAVLNTLRLIQQPIARCLEVSRYGCSPKGCSLDDQIQASPYPQMLLGTRGRILAINLQAEAILGSSEITAHKYGYFFISQGNIESAFQMALSYVLKNRIPRIVPLPSLENGRTMHLVLSPDERGGALNVLATFLTGDEPAHLIKPLCDAHGFGDRQAEILELCYKGLGTKEISQILGITEGHVQRLLGQVYKELEIPNRIPHLVAFLRKLHQLH